MRGVDEDFRRFKNGLVEKGLLSDDATFGWRYLTGLLVMMGVAIGLQVFGSVLGWLAGVVIMAIYYYLAGFFAHEVVHGAVFRGIDKRWVEIISGVSQGMSSRWWDEKHTIHHRFVSSYRRNGDRLEILDKDIDTAPLIVWSRLFLEESPSKWIHRQQHWLIWPMCLVLRFKWTWDGIKMGTNRERIAIVAHFVLLVTALEYFGDQDLITSLAWIIAAMAIDGPFLIFFSVYSHAGLPPIDANQGLSRPEHVALACRNMRGGRLVRFFAGGMDLHIEHHLFPMAPRSRLPEISKEVQSFFRERGIPYQEVSFLEALKGFHQQFKLRV